MKSTSRSVQTEVDTFLAYLLNAEIALYVTRVANNGGRVSWHPHNPNMKLIDYRKPPSLMEYRKWVEAGAYSALLFDGALLQVTYDIAGGNLVGHRLAYIPCPFDVDLGLLQEEPVLDVLDIYAAGNPAEVVLKSAIRFDFDLSAASTSHPAAHLTINSMHCRIACLAPLRLGHFADFVFRHFYPDLWKAHSYFDSLSRNDWGRSTLTEDEARRMHVSWRS